MESKLPWRDKGERDVTKRSFYLEKGKRENKKEERRKENLLMFTNGSLTVQRLRQTEGQGEKIKG